MNEGDYNIEMSSIMGDRYPSLCLSLLWKARVFYEKERLQEGVALCKSRMAMAYFSLWQRHKLKADRFIIEARRLVNKELKREDFLDADAQQAFDAQRKLINSDTKPTETSIVPTNLPNLLDVLEDIAFDEEYFHLDKGVMRSLFPTHYQEDMFETIQMSDGKVRLYPCTLSPFRYYRGQSDKLEGKQCKPSLFRGLTAAEMFHERLCLKELELLLQDYPLTKVFDGVMCYRTPEGYKQMFLNVDTTALGQHYGIKTSVLDLTADKWVAAFFAATEYKNGEYHPYKKEGEGVVYIYRYVPALDEASERLNAVGLQPFMRPGCQAGLVYKMMPGEDFNKIAQRRVFKHDPAVSELIYNYCHRSKNLFPDEILEVKVNAIRKSHCYSQKALTNTINDYYHGSTQEEISSYLTDLGITIQEAPVLAFTEEELKLFAERWNQEKEHFFDSIFVRTMFA